MDKYNIYLELGFPLWSKENRDVPCVFDDGSSNDEVKLEALKMLGFIDTDEYRFESYIELGIREEDYLHRVNIVPEKLILTDGTTFYLKPRKEQAGRFNLHAVMFDDEGEVLENPIEDITAWDLSSVIPIAKQASEELYSQWSKYFFELESPYDPLITKGPDGYSYSGLPILEELSAFFCTRPNPQGYKWTTYIRVLEYEPEDEFIKE
jgi:hypothetical protein